MEEQKEKPASIEGRLRTDAPHSGSVGWNMKELEKIFGRKFKKIRLIAEYPIPGKAEWEIIDCLFGEKGVRFFLKEDDGSFLVSADFYPVKNYSGSKVEMIGTTATGAEIVLTSVTPKGMETIFNAYRFSRTQGLRALYREKFVEHASARLSESPRMNVDDLTLELYKVSEAEKRMYRKTGVYTELKQYVGYILDDSSVIRDIAVEAISRRAGTAGTV